MAKTTNQEALHYVIFTTFHPNPNILITTVCSNNFNTCSSVNMKYQTSQKHKTTHKIIILSILTKIKVNFSCYRTGVVQRVGRGVALLFNDRGTRRG